VPVSNGHFPVQSGHSLRHKPWRAELLNAQASRSGRSTRSHRELILNYFRAKKEYSSGVVEGLNTKVKLVTRKSFEFRKPETIKTALFHALGRLPEPEHAHRFG